ncbi:YdcH family protein [Ferrimonas marina]|uniref:GTP-binding protein n=1 Tax=Ferrimonas marina TaxID=299255 RepID=A0A1M5X718_9GAMM|nr:YdcH family protein [Ferrimonas marina]SHH95294.1 hypothetical protein SAMN02745129_3264 [Ferrimonas marina]
MIVDDHSLISEFPKDKALIQDLNMRDDEFHVLYNQYHEIDREVHRIEEGLENTADDYLEGLKVKRLQLKDQLFQRIKSAGA